MPIIELAHVRRVYFLSFCGPFGETPRRRFYRFPARSVLSWFSSIWREREEHGEWTSKLRHEETIAIEMMLSRVFDEEGDPPVTEEELLEHVRNSLDADAEPHFVHGETDDDEGTQVEYFIFDDAFLETPDALERLPHPDRGRFRSANEDRYAALVERLAER